MEGRRNGVSVVNREGGGGETAGWEVAVSPDGYLSDVDVGQIPVNLSEHMDMGNMGSSSDQFLDIDYDTQQEFAQNGLLGRNSSSHNLNRHSSSQNLNRLERLSQLLPSSDTETRNEQY